MSKLKAGSASCLASASRSRTSKSSLLKVQIHTEMRSGLTGFTICSKVASSEGKKPLSSLLRREIAQALDDPSLVVAVAKFLQRALQLLDVAKRPHSQQPLFQCADEPLDTAVSIRPPHECQRRFQPQKSNLHLVMLAHVLAAPNRVGTGCPFFPKTPAMSAPTIALYG